MDWNSRTFLALFSYLELQLLTFKTPPVSSNLPNWYIRNVSFKRFYYRKSVYANLFFVKWYFSSEVGVEDLLNQFKKPHLRMRMKMNWVSLMMMMMLGPLRMRWSYWGDEKKRFVGVVIVDAFELHVWG